jgi:hypothetical protein
MNMVVRTLTQISDTDVSSAGSGLPSVTMAAATMVDALIPQRAQRSLYLFCGGHDNFALQSVRMTISQRRTVNRAGEAVRWPERTSGSIFNRKLENANARAGAVAS